MKTLKLFAAPLAAAIALGLLAGCAGDPSRSDPDVAPATAAEAAPASEAAEPLRETAPAPAPARKQVRDDAPPPVDEITGIVACDDYLGSYKSCHQVIGTYEPDSLASRYDLLRASLIKDSKDPARRTELEARCNNFSQMMKDALNGRECVDQAPEVAPTGFEDSVEDVEAEK